METREDYQALLDAARTALQATYIDIDDLDSALDALARIRAGLKSVLVRFDY